MRFRKLRIAWSVVWITAAMLVCTAWVQSYRKCTSFEILVTPAYRYYVHSLRGTLALDCWPREFLGVEVMPIYRESDLLRLVTHAGLKIERDSVGGIDSVRVSYWLLSPTAIVIAVIPWVTWRFSLRALLIATTLVAAVLGLAVYASGQ